ncbi:hypothetical protein [Mycolicibacterium peregrinum]|uniref:hypothetical protein n=1 Tax=Mycolicibacterium peregrinum TaxID=43304 RepID=UPI003AB039EC
MNDSQNWLTGAIHRFEYDVASLVPPIFEAYARIFHPAYERTPSTSESPTPNSEPGENAVTWHRVAQANNRIAHPCMEWGSIVGSWATERQQGLWDRKPDVGLLPSTVAQELSRILKRHTEKSTVVYGLWDGYGHQISDATPLNLPKRRMYLTEREIDDASQPFGIAGRTANLWWPTDHTWVVATDIDLMSTYVGGTTQCIEAILNSESLEALAATSDQRITWDSDTINPLPASPVL